MKQGSMTLLAIAIALVFITSAFLVAITKPPTSEDVVITGSDIPFDLPSNLPSNLPPGEWGTLYKVYDPSFTFHSEADSINSYLNNSQTFIAVLVWHFNSSSDAGAAYQTVLDGSANQYLWGWPAENRKNISVGDAGFAALQHWANPSGEGYEIAWLTFIKGNYLVYMLFGGWEGYPPNWTDADCLKVALIQADKIP